MSTFQRVCYFVSDSVNSRNRFAGRYATCMLSAKADRNHRIYYACVQELLRASWMHYIYVYAANLSILREDRLQQLFDESITNPERHRKDKRGERMLRRLIAEKTYASVRPAKGEGRLEVDNAARFSGGRLRHDGNIAQGFCLDLV